MADRLPAPLAPHTTGSASQAGLPDWAPWGVLAGLVTLGLAGGVGLIPLRMPGSLHATTPSETPASPPTRAVVPQAAAGGPRITIRNPSGRSAAQPAGAAPTDARAGTTEPEKVAVRHLVVTFSQSPLGAHRQIARSKEEAKKRAEEALARARKGEDFSELVVEYSDEPDAATRKGRFGKFTKKDAISPFGDAAFALEVGQISDVVESQFGFHVILRTE